MQNIKEGIEGHPAKWYSDVFDLVFPDLDRDAANRVWAAQLEKKEKGGKKEKEGEGEEEEE